MKIKRKNNFTLRIKILLGATLSCVVFIAFYFAKAEESVSSLPNDANQLSAEEQKTLDELKKKAEIYRQIIEIKQTQGETLSNQLSITDSSIQEVQAQIDVTTQQINDLNSQIIRLEAQIKEKDATIESQKKILGDLMQSYYEFNQTGVIASYLAADGNMASFMVTKDRIGQIGDKISELVDSITNIKEGLQFQRIDFDQKKSEFVDANQKLQDQVDSLASVKKQKETLLTQTQGEEDRYQQLLANIEKQKQELLDIDQFFAASGLSADSYPKPDSKYFASTDWFYYQWDSRWANENIGNTKTLMKSYGCAVTALAMVMKQHSVITDPGKMANQAIFSGDLINWPNKWSSSISIDLKSSRATATSKDIAAPRHGTLSSVDWSIIDTKLKDDVPVIVYIKKSNGSNGHYVVIHHKDASGKYVVHDPYFGSNIFLETSRALVGAMGTSSSTSIDQMIVY